MADDERDAVVRTIHGYFTGKYPSLEVPGKEIFQLPNGVYYYVDAYPDGEGGEMSYLLCGWDGETDFVKWWMYEDRERFFLSDYDSVDEMIDDMEGHELNE